MKIKTDVRSKALASWCSERPSACESKIMDQLLINPFIMNYGWRYRKRRISKAKIPVKNSIRYSKSQHECIEYCPMAYDDSAEVAPMLLSLKVPAIEKVFTECVTDIGQILVLDGIDILPDGFRVRSHDLHGQLPEMINKTAGTHFRTRTGLEGKPASCSPS